MYKIGRTSVDVFSGIGMDGITILGTIGAALLVVDFIDVILVIDLVFDEGTRGRSIELCDDCCDDPGVVT